MMISSTERKHPVPRETILSRNQLDFPKHKFHPVWDVNEHQRSNTSALELFFNDCDFEKASLSVDNATTVRLICNTLQGHSIIVYLKWVEFVFYVDWSDDFSVEQQLEFSEEIKQMLPKNAHHLFLPVQLEYREKSHGFTNGKQFPMMRLSFLSQPLMKRIANKLDQDYRYTNKVFESKLKWTVLFTDRYQLTPASWIRIKGARYQWLNTNGLTTAQAALQCNVAEVSEIKDRLDFPEQLFFSLDSETYNGIKKIEVPRAEYPANCVTHIGHTIYRFPKPLKEDTDKEPIIYRVIFALKEHSVIPNTEVYWYDNERDLLIAWHKWFTECADPDVFLGYNIEYDLEFLWLRLEYYGLEAQKVWGRFLDEYSLLQYRNQEDDVVTEKQQHQSPEEEIDPDDESSFANNEQDDKKSKDIDRLRLRVIVDHVMQIKQIRLDEKTQEFEYQVHHICPRRFENDSTWYRHSQIKPYQKRSFYNNSNTKTTTTRTSTTASSYSMKQEVSFCKTFIARVDRITGGLYYLFYPMSNVHNPCGFQDSELAFDSFHTSVSVDMPGRPLRLDMLPQCKKTYRWRYYDLNTACEMVLNNPKLKLTEQQKELNRKHEVSPSEIWASHESDNVQEHTRIASYCIQDTLLPLKIMLQMMTVEKLYSMCRVVYLPPEITMLGEQNKVVSLVVRQAHRQHIVLDNAPINCPQLPHTWTEEYIEQRRIQRLALEAKELSENGLQWKDGAKPTKKKTKLSKAEKKRALDCDSTIPYKGATVIEPIRAAYTDSPVSTLDFMSLYPSMMIAYRLCFRNLVIYPEYDNLPGVEYRNDVILDDDGKEVITFRWAVTDGILPAVLIHLLDERKRIKNLLKIEKDPFKKMIYDLWQLSVKLASNATYGTVGVRKKRIAKLPFLPIAICTTFHGRRNLQRTKDMVEARYGVKIVYGDTDSVFVNWNFPKEWSKEQKFEQVIRLSTEAAQYVTENSVKPIALDFEKWAYPLFLWDPKSYGGTFYTDKRVDAEGTEKQSGMSAVRRDNCPFAVTVMMQLSHILFSKGDVDEARTFVESEMCRMARGEIHIEQLVITAALSKAHYANPVCHAEVAKKMGQRGALVQGGDRIRYVFIKLPHEKQMRDVKAWQKAEDPDWVVKQKLELDYEWYIEHCFKNKISKYFSLNMADPSVIFNKALAIVRRNHTIDSFFQPVIAKKQKTHNN